MDLTKIKLHTMHGWTSGSTAVYLILREGKRTLVTPPVLRKRRPDVFKLIHYAKIPVDTGVVFINDEPYPLAKGGYLKENRGKIVLKKVPKDAMRVFRVHPRRLSEKQRESMAGLGEKGKYRAEFVEEGMTGEERHLRAREQSALQLGEWTRKESERKKAQRDARRSRADYEAPERESKPRFVGLGAKDVAELAELEPVEIRKFLRAKKIGKRGGRYAFTEPEAQKIARAAKKHYARRAA